MEIFASMEHERVQPDVITYSSLISACKKGKNPERALEILASMEHQHLQPDVIDLRRIVQRLERHAKDDGVEGA